MTEGAPLSGFLLPRTLIKGSAADGLGADGQMDQQVFAPDGRGAREGAAHPLQEPRRHPAQQEQIAHKWTTELADVPEVVEAEEDDVLTAEEETTALTKRNAALAETDAEAEIELSEADVMGGERGEFFG